MVKRKTTFKGGKKNITAFQKGVKKKLAKARKPFLKSDGILNDARNGKLRYL